MIGARWLPPRKRFLRQRFCECSSICDASKGAELTFHSGFFLDGHVVLGGPPATLPPAPERLPAGLIAAQPIVAAVADGHEAYLFLLVRTFPNEGIGSCQAIRGLLG